jgi:NhaP-type Na+/H+ or K+/H+ antiporter
MNIFSNGLEIFILFVLLGVLLLRIFRQFKMPVPVLLFLFGLFAKLFVGNVELAPLLVFSLIILVFDTGAHFIPRKFDTHSLLLSDFILLSIIVNWFIAGLLIYYLITPTISVLTVSLSLLISCMMTSCSQFEVLKAFKIKKNRLYTLTILEDHLSNPITLLISIIVIYFISFLSNSTILVALKDVLSLLLVDLGVGLFFGLVMLFVIVRVLKRKLVHLATFIFAFLTYIFALYLSGGGFIAVIVLSFFFHNVSTHIPDMGEFAPFVRHFVYSCVFIMMGYMLTFNLSLLLFTIILFLVYVIVRYLLLHLFLKDTRLFLALDCPKGLAMGAVTIFAIMAIKVEFLYNTTISQLLSAVIIFYMLCIMLSYSMNLFKKEITY